MVDILLAFRQESVSLMFEELITSLTDFDVFTFPQGDNLLQDHFDVLIVEPEIQDVKEIIKKANTILWAGLKPKHITIGSEMPVPINYKKLIAFLEKKVKQNNRMLRTGVFLDMESQLISIMTLEDNIKNNDNNTNNDIDENNNIQLTEKETLLLDFLLNNPKGVSRSLILKEVWGYDEDAETKTVETHISKLRNKLENNLAHITIKVSDSKYQLFTESQT